MILSAGERLLYIDYEKIGKFLRFGKSFFYDLKVKQNLDYIKRNRKRVLGELRDKLPLNVVFYVYDESKWKSQSVYDWMEKDDRFDPLVIVTKNCAPEGNPNFQTVDDVKRCYEFFKSKGMNVEYGYDVTANFPYPSGSNEYFIPFEKFYPDIIIYSHPWYVYENQGPVVCSKFALTYYIPYFLPASEQWHEYGLRFHQYIYRHYVPTESVREYYSKNMPSIEHSFRVVGHPVLDSYKNNETAEKKYIIYAPHWTVCGDNLRFGTFKWSGEKVLELAKAHKELNWVFRPHPLLYNFAITSGFMRKQDIDQYYDEWKSFAEFSEGGDYIDLFKQSYAMITDCGSFLTEYFVTGNPVIHLISEHLEPNSTIKEIDKTYYMAYNTDDLIKYFHQVILDKGDYKKEERIKLLEKLGFKNSNSAEKIINDILSDVIS